MLGTDGVKGSGNMLGSRLVGGSGYMLKGRLGDGFSAHGEQTVRVQRS